MKPLNNILGQNKGENVGITNISKTISIPIIPKTD
jgi:hypothetical protein